MDRVKQVFQQISTDDEVIKVITNHSLRVMYFSNKLARKVGCYSEEFRLAALFHDIGKIGVHRDILLKQQKLTELEYIVVQSHSHIGNTIIRKAVGKQQAARFVRDHHERWDGKGYPRGLKGDQITLEGRIINICDAFDTMTNERRTYKQQTMDYKEAFAELKRCEWKQFDGALVDTFIQMMEELDLPNAELWYNDPELMRVVFEPDRVEDWSEITAEIREFNDTPYAGDSPDRPGLQQQVDDLRSELEQQQKMLQKRTTEIHSLQDQMIELKQSMQVRQGYMQRMNRFIDEQEKSGTSKKRRRS